MSTRNLDGLGTKTRRLVERFGVDRVFQAARNAESSRHVAWWRYCTENPHESGKPGVFRPEAMRLKGRIVVAHGIGHELYHYFDLEI